MFSLGNARDDFNQFEFGPNIYSKEKCANSEVQSYDKICMSFFFILIAATFRIYRFNQQKKCS